ncbi:MAG: TIM barrel protein [Phycisphaerales bacterium]|nr:MAG: TIM barrel protein [Phycisphaerales bacterium]
MALRKVLDRLSEQAFRYVQLSAAQPGFRPRELSKSARRDLRATLSRRELRVAGLDLWIPPTHFLDSTSVDRAVDAVSDAIELAADLGRCPLSVTLPSVDEEDCEAVVRELAAHARAFGVQLADHTLPPARRSGVGVGIDPAAVLSIGEDPASTVASCSLRLISVRLCDLLRSGARGPAGEPRDGRLNVRIYRRAIATCEFTRPVVVDMRQWSDPWSGLEKTALAWHIAGG